MIICMCYSLLAALLSKTFLSHPPFKYPRSAPEKFPSKAVELYKNASRQYILELQSRSTI